MAKTSTQSFVPIKEVRDGVIIRADGVMCGVLLVSSINFSLKSADERTAILNQFQNLLNSLEVSIQITVHSRRLNIKPYLNYLEEILANQKNELMRLQTSGYIDFIKKFTSTTNIMEKEFFITIPYGVVDPGSILRKKKDNDDGFEKNRFQLQQRVEFVRSGISGTGLRAIQLNTEEIMEMLFLVYNPGEVENVAISQ